LSEQLALELVPEMIVTYHSRIMKDDETFEKEYNEFKP